MPPNREEIHAHVRKTNSRPAGDEKFIRSVLIENLFEQIPWRGLVVFGPSACDRLISGH
jgi:hypothetical protein